MIRLQEALAFVLLTAPALTQTTTRVDVDSAGGQAGGENNDPAISADGRYVAFDSAASNLVAGDTNDLLDVFVRDRQTGVTERVSISSGGAEGNGVSYWPTISADGRFVAFTSRASNLVTGDFDGIEDIFVRDRLLGTTERVSVATSGLEGNGLSETCSISGDGRFVAFLSWSSNLVAGDANGTSDIFVRDRLNGTTERVSVDSSGNESNGMNDFKPVISRDGRYVAFASLATNLVAGDTNGKEDVFVHDRQTGTTERVDVSTGGTQANNASAYDMAISSDGRFVAFASIASNLVAGDANATTDVFLRDRQSGTTERASLTTGGTQANAGGFLPGISADGRFVSFVSGSTNLVPGDTNAHTDVFLRDRQLGTTERISVDSAGVQENSDIFSCATISDDGRFLAFASFASNLVVGDTNGNGDIFVRDRTGGTVFTSLCEPGVAGVATCPCANAPGGSGRGCENSAASGGASIAASGATILSSDSLVFTTSGEKPTATSVLLQGTTVVAGGATYGQGVRCVGGTLKRLFTKTAAGGSITAPNFGAGDPTVSARSAAKGNPISAGQSRWYLVFYRDPVVLGGCPSASTFNATQTGRINWAP